MKYFIWFYLTLFVLSGCVTNFADKDSASVKNAVVVFGSKFDKGKSYIGPNINSSHLLSSETFRLIRNDDITALSVDFLYTGGGWAFVESASLEGGDVKKITNNRQVLGCSSGCSYMEKTLLALPENYLEEKQDTGFSVRYNSKNRGGIAVEVPSEYIRGFLSAIP